MRILSLVIMFLFFLSCNVEDVKKDSTRGEEIIKKIEQFTFSNPSIKRCELPIVHDKEMSEIYDVIRLDYTPRGTYEHTYMAINFSGKLIVSYKCQSGKNFCSFGFSYNHNDYDSVEKWNKLVSDISGKNINTTNKKFHTINIETLIDGVHSKIYAEPDSQDDKVLSVLRQMRGICLPEISQDTLNNELTRGCICDTSVE